MSYGTLNFRRFILGPLFCVVLSWTCYDLGNLKGAAMEQIIQYVYTAQLDLRTNTVLDIYEAADYLQVVTKIINRLS